MGDEIRGSMTVRDDDTLPYQKDVATGGRLPLFTQAVELAKRFREAGDVPSAQAVEAAAISLRETYRHAPDLYPALESMRDTIDTLLRSAQRYYIFDWPNPAGSS
jgi:hypothetical protein